VGDFVAVGADVGVSVEGDVGVCVAAGVALGVGAASGVCVAVGVGLEVDVAVGVSTRVVAIRVAVVGMTTAPERSASGEGWQFRSKLAAKTSRTITGQRRLRTRVNMLIDLSSRVRILSLAQQHRPIRCPVSCTAAI